MLAKHANRSQVGNPSQSFEMGGFAAVFHGSATVISVTGTNVATDTCGHVSPLNSNMTVCVYWICGYVTGTEFGAVIAEAD